MLQKLTILFVGVSLMLPLTLAHADCSDCDDTEAGASVLEINYDDTTGSADYTCAGCFDCWNSENRVACCTTCVDSNYITPTHVRYEWNADTNHWDVVAAWGACQDKKTIRC